MTDDAAPPLSTSTSLSPPAMPARCPACAHGLVVERLRCDGCGTEVQGAFSPCRYCALDDEARRVLDLFIDARGNLRDVQRALGVSYPTARQRVDAMFGKLAQADEARRRGPPPLDVLGRLRRGEITVDQAEALLRAAKS